jgi:poly(U)-binding-splicing factor PUF60
MSNPSVLALIQQQQQQELAQRQQLAASIQQQMKQGISQTVLGAGGTSAAQLAVNPTQTQQSAAQALAAALSAAQQNPLTAGVQSNVPMQRGVEHRIYVGSLHYDLTEADVRGVFGAFGNITNVVMSHEPSTGKSKGYCFIEYESAVSAQQALTSMNGFQLAGRPIKVNKPTFANQQPTTTAIPPMGTSTTPGNAAMLALAAALGRPTATTAPPSTAAALAAATAPPAQPVMTMPPSIPPTTMTGVGVAPVLQPAVLPSTTLPAQPNSFQIIVSNIAPGINGDTLRTIFEPFGTVLNCNVPDGASSGILTYQQLQPAKDAVEQMDGFELLDQRLKVQWVGAPPLAGQVPAAQAPQPVASTPPTSEEATTTTETASSSSTSSTWRCTLLRNMVSVEETNDPELEGEILEECTKYGKVEQVKIVVMDKESVRIFVLYEDHEGANKAKMSLDTRFFGGRVISGVLYDHDVFLAGNYSA